MSDDEILNMPEPDEQETDNEEEVEAVVEESEDQDESGSEEQENQDDDEDSGEQGEQIEDNESSEEESKDDQNTDESEEQEENDESEESKPEAKPEELNHKSELDRILNTPIKANGGEIKLKSVDEAIQLIQMGANYHKKMAGIKPHMKLLKTLEQNKLLDENEIAFLIDVKNKNPEAIAKLLADSNLDPLDLDKSLGEKYVPTAKAVSDNDVVLDEVINELKDSEHFTKLNTVVTKQWDNGSRGEIYNNPEILRQLHDHMIPDSTGKSLFEHVSAEVQRRRMLGQISSSVSDYQAYIQTGNDLYEQHVREQQAQQATVVPKRVVKPASKPSNVVDPQTVKKQKQVASPVKAKTTTSKQSDFNPLDLSDDEFEKLSANRY